MIRHKITSTNIAEAGWEDNTLFLLFNKGTLYTYGGVPRSVYDDFVGAPSQGKFFHEFIKTNYEATKKDQGMVDYFRGVTEAV